MDKFDGNECIDGAESDDEALIQPSQRLLVDAANAYPDPEDIPTYPWFGSRIGEKETHISSALIEPLIPRTSSQSEENSEDEDTVYTENGDMTHVRFDYNNALVDPDFEVSGDSAMYVYALDTMHMCISDRNEQ